MAQRYTQQIPRERMVSGLCPECGLPPLPHLSDTRFWIPRQCDLTREGVLDRIAQYESDLNESQGA